VLFEGGAKKQRATIVSGEIRCHAFPIVILTSNGEREFPPPFLRRCVPLNIPEPDKEILTKIINNNFMGIPIPDAKMRADLITEFLNRRERGDLATDQLLNAIYLAKYGAELDKPLESAKEKVAEPDKPAIEPSKEKLIDIILQQLNPRGS
jgi:MoxR-like ATPase